VYLEIMFALFMDRFRVHIQVYLYIYKYRYNYTYLYIIYVYAYIHTYIYIHIPGNHVRSIYGELQGTLKEEKIKKSVCTDV
jgi:hypothetical protein